MNRRTTSNRFIIWTSYYRQCNRALVDSAIWNGVLLSVYDRNLRLIVLRFVGNFIRNEVFNYIRTENITFHRLLKYAPLNEFWWTRIGWKRHTWSWGFCRKCLKVWTVFVEQRGLFHTIPKSPIVCPRNWKAKCFCESPEIYLILDVSLNPNSLVTKLFFFF